MRYVLLVGALFIAVPAFAQQPNTSDQYWQQLLASKEAQSSQQIVNLAQQLDAAHKQIADLQKELAGEKAKQAKSTDKK